MFSQSNIPFIDSGRSEELASLTNYLKLCLNGKPQIAFISGEAGIGKTTLVKKFCEDAKNLDMSIVSCWANCNSFTSKSDAYSPFKQIFSQLIQIKSENSYNQDTNKLTRKFVDIIFELGPDLIGLFLPIAGFIAKGLAFGSKSTEIWKQVVDRNNVNQESINLNKTRFFEQMLQIIVEISKKSPLVLIIDDIQWADNGTLDLIFYVMREINRFDYTPILFVCMYRLSEIESSKNEHTAKKNLISMINNLERYFGKIQIDLSQSLQINKARSFVDTIIDLEPNILDNKFREEILRYTSGVPLFTIELIQLLSDKKILRQNEYGIWYLANAVSIDSFPPKLEGVIRERMNLLEMDVRSLLIYASIEGDLFTAEVIAIAKKKEIIWVIEKLIDDLVNKSQIIITNNVFIVLSQVLHLFSFRHSLFREYLYNQLDLMQKQIFHLKIGQAMELIYGSENQDFFVKLATHFSLGMDYQKALNYYYKGSIKAWEVFAYEETIDLCCKAISISESIKNNLITVDLLIIRCKAYHRTQQFHLSLIDLTSLIKLSEEINDAKRQCNIKDLSVRYFIFKRDHIKALVEAEKSLDFANKSEDELLISRSLSTIASVYRSLGKYEQAVIEAENSLKLLRKTGKYTHIPDSLIQLGLIHSVIGQYSKAEIFINEAIHIANNLRLYKISNDCSIQLSYIYLGQGKLSNGLNIAQKALHEAKRINDTPSKAESLNAIGWYYYEVGLLEESLYFLREAKDSFTFADNKRGITLTLANSAFAMYLANDFDNAKSTLKEALRLSKKIESHQLTAILLNILGWIYQATNQIDLAIKSHTVSGKIWQNLNQHPRFYESLAGLINCYLKNEEKIKARELTELLSKRLLSKNIEGIEYTVYVYETCINALNALSNFDETNILIEDAYNLIISRSKEIEKREHQTSYMSSKPNMQILTWQKKTII